MFVRSRQIAALRGTEKNSARIGNMEEQSGKSRGSLKGMLRVQIGEYMLVFDPEETQDEFFKTKAKKELRETPDIVKESLHDIKLLIRGEPNLYLPQDDEFYTKFLRPCKWYPQSAFALIKRFYRFRQNYARLCDNLLPSLEKNPLASGLFIPLPNRTDNGCRVLLVQAGAKWNPKLIGIDEMFKAVMLIIDAALAEPKTQICGVHVILDVDGFSLSQVMYVTPSFAAMVADWVQRCIPSRVKGIHIMNQPFIFKMVFNIFKPFLREKTRKRLHFHGTNHASLMAYISPNALPTKFGGDITLPDESVGESIWQHFCDKEEFFKESMKYGYISQVKG